MHVTKHGYDRTRERIGVPKRAVMRLAGKAFEHGQKIGDFSGEARVYLENKMHKSAIGNRIRVYHGFAFIFADDVLITTWAMPKELAA